MQHKIWLPAKECLGYLFCNNLKYTVSIKKELLMNKYSRLYGSIVDNSSCHTTYGQQLNGSRATSIFLDEVPGRFLLPTANRNKLLMFKNTIFRT